jgi:hypothetical protein
MNWIRVVITFLLCFCLQKSSSGQANLEGRRFAIDLTLKGVHDSFDTLYFQGSKLSYATARKYGFAPAEYKSKEKNTGRIVGTALNESKANGTMLWNFVVMEDSISGTATFDSRVQNAITYDFTGKEMK